MKQRTNSLTVSVFRIGLFLSGIVLGCSSPKSSQKNPENSEETPEEIPEKPISNLYNGTNTKKTLSEKTGRVCTVDNWCWYNPSPHGQEIKKIWASHTKNIWTVSDKLLMQYDGEQWHIIELEIPDREVTNVWGHDSQNIWITGKRTIAYWNRSQWNYTEIEFPKPDQYMYAVHGSSPKDVWAVGSSGAIMHWDGIQWTATNSTTSQDLTDVCATQANEAWAIGKNTMLVWNGQEWKDVPNKPLNPKQLACVSRGYGNTYAMVLTEQNGLYECRDRVCSNEKIAEAHTLATLNSFELLISYHNDILHRRTRDVSFEPITKIPYFMTTITGLTTGEIIVGNTVGQIGLWHQNSWTSLHKFTPYSETDWIADIHGHRTNFVWAVGPQLIVRWNGQQWNKISNPSNSELKSIWSIDDLDAWAVGSSGTVLHWNGQQWSSFTIDPRMQTDSFNKVWASDSKNVWLMSNKNNLWNWNGSLWTLHQVPDIYNPSILRGTNARNLWVSDGRSTYSYDGNQWKKRAVPGSYVVRDLWLFGEHNTFALTHSELLEWNGENWIKHLVPAYSEMSKIWAASPNDIWIVGGLGTIVHWDGISWQSKNQSQSDFDNIWGINSKDIWVTGQNTMIRYQPE